MKNSWLVWVFVVGVVLTILIAFNYQGAQDTVPLSEIFPEAETYPLEIEYVDEQPVSTASNIQQTATESPAPAQLASTAPTSVATVATAPAAPPVPKQAAAPQAASVTTVSTQGYKYSIQVASFKDKAKAQKKVEELSKKDHQAFLVSKTLREKGTWHRVYVGKFQSKSEADNYLPKVKKNHSSSFIIATK